MFTHIFFAVPLHVEIQTHTRLLTWVQKECTETLIANQLQLAAIQ